VDANCFIDALGLDPEVQQDVNEFLLLVFAALSSSLETQSNPELRDLVKNTFLCTKAVLSE
jgi:hypothetical protein